MYSALGMDKNGGVNEYHHHIHNLQSSFSGEMTNLPGDTCLVLTADHRPRLRWTAELHERFVDAVTQLGGPDSTLNCFDLCDTFSFLICFSICLLLLLCMHSFFTTLG